LFDQLQSHASQRAPEAGGIEDLPTLDEVAVGRR
jgi:hypothetical protein